MVKIDPCPCVLASSSVRPLRDLHIHRGITQASAGARRPHPLPSSSSTSCFALSALRLCVRHRAYPSIRSLGPLEPCPVSAPPAERQKLCVRASTFHPSQGGTTGSDSGGRQRRVDVKFLQVMMCAAAAADYYVRVHHCMSNRPYIYQIILEAKSTARCNENRYG